VIKSPFATNEQTMEMNLKKKKKALKEGKGNEDDGMKILSDWGPCSVMCGGGVMTM